MILEPPATQPEMPGNRLAYEEPESPMDSRSPQALDSVVISPNASVAEALERLDAAGTGALVLCSMGRQLNGLLTDGDIRRAILRGVSLKAACGTIASLNPVTAPCTISAAEALRIMNHHDINHLPMVDSQGMLQDFLLWKDLVGDRELKTPASQRIDKVVIPPTASIAEAIARLDKAGTGALILCSRGRELSGLLTDGDIRRAILRGISLETPCETISSAKPMTALHSISPEEALQLMNQHDINHLPVVDSEGNIVEFLLRRDLVTEKQLGLSAVIMAGGFGKRLLPLTEQVPKPMLPVGDRPLLELTIQKLRGSGIRQVNLTTHYLPERISDHFGNGEDFGVKLEYFREDHPLGTAGGLKLLDRPDGPLLVMNGDILTGVSFQEMFDYHRKHAAEITVGVRKYEVKVPFGVVECEDVRVKQLQEKPSLNFFINAGMYLLEPSAWDLIPEGRHFDMTDLIQQLLDMGRPVVSFPIMEYWLDIGQPSDYERAQDDYKNGRL
jgi:dTDP-glucose pyrophosphorylase/predicted transcriptional regulator